MYVYIQYEMKCCLTYWAGKYRETDHMPMLDFLVFAQGCKISETRIV